MRFVDTCRELILRGSRCKLVRQLEAAHELELSPRSLRRITTSPSSLSGKGFNLKPCLGLQDIIAFGVASTMGAGIFVTTGVAAKNFSGPALFISVLIAGICCLFDALCYSEFSSRIPDAGSAYTYAYNTMGEFMAFLMGWVLLLEYGLSAAATARGFSAYVGSFLTALGVQNPVWLVNMPIFTSIGAYFSLSVLAPLAVLSCTLVITFGVEESSLFNRCVTYLNIGLILLIWIGSIFYTNLERFEPFAPYGGRGVVEGAGVLFFCFIGFDSVSTLSEEVRQPQRDIPIGIIGTLTAVVVLYVGTSISLIGMVPLPVLNDYAPLAEAFAYHECNWMYILVSFGAVSTTLCTTFTCIMAQPRVFYRMAQDGLWFSAFCKLHPQSQLPIQGIWLTGGAVSFVASIVNFDVLVRLISSGVLLSYTVVCIGVLLVRYTHHPQTSCTPSMNLGSYIALSQAGFQVSLAEASGTYPSSAEAGEVPLNDALNIRTAEDGGKQENLESFGVGNNVDNTVASHSAARNVERWLSVSQSEDSADSTAIVLPGDAKLWRNCCGLNEHLAGSIDQGTAVHNRSSTSAAASSSLKDRVCVEETLSVEFSVSEIGSHTRECFFPTEARKAHMGTSSGYIRIAMQILPWLFTIISVIVGFAIQEKWPNPLLWSVVSVVIILTLFYVILHAFHELGSRKNFSRQVCALIDSRARDLTPEHLLGNYDSAAGSLASHEGYCALIESNSSVGASAATSSVLGYSRQFRCPCVPLIPLAGIFLNSYLLASLQISTFFHTFLYIAVGAGMYIFYGAWNSKLHYNAAYTSGI